MERSLFPFCRSPDVLLLELPTSSNRLTLAPFETVWGKTDEILCYWDGVLFGAMTDGRYGRFAKLLPTLDRQRDYPWPPLQTWIDACGSIFQEFPNLEVWCERDCDQYVVDGVTSVKDLLLYFGCVISFSTGASGDCPSFSYRPNAKSEPSCESRP